MHIIEKTLGTGNPGLKTLALRGDRSHIQKAGFRYVDNVALTPRVFERFLERSGALDASADEAQRRIHATDFDELECASILSAFLELPEHLRYRLLVRSDDYPRGIGLWYSGAVSVSESNGSRTVALIEQLKRQIKLVLASDFKDDTKTFKEKKGITHSPGILLMPLVGQRIGSNGSSYFAPSISINYLGDTQDAIIAVGAGFGGSNSRSARTDVISLVPHSLILDSHMVFSNWPAVKEDGGDVEFVSFKDILSLLDQSLFDFLNTLLKRLLTATGPRYLEIVKGEGQSWAVVQSAPVEVPSLAMPSVKESHILLEAASVLSSAVVRSSVLRYANSSPRDEDIEFNRRNHGYILVLDAKTCGRFANSWPLHALSNAAAIILHVNEISRPVASHLGGMFRELGIPVIAGQLDARFMDLLMRRPNQNMNFVVYADEFSGRGFLAREQQ